jgi:ribosomal protein S18 acetylase RimI-like enzyme
MTLKIRPYEQSDRDPVIALWAEAFADDPPWNDPAMMLSEKLAFQPKGLLVGIAADQVIAVVMAGYDGHRGWINALAVSANHRGRGYGKAMLYAAINDLDSHGAVKVNLQIRGDNTALEGFYRSCGFISENRISMGMLTPKGAMYQD